MSYSLVRRSVGCSPSVQGLGVVYPEISGISQCMGGLYWYNKRPPSDTREACCPLSTWDESTVRANRPDLWQVYLEDIVRKNIHTHFTREGIDNAAYDIPMQFSQAPMSLDYSAKLVAAAERATANFDKLYQPRAMIVTEAGGETFCRSSGRWPLWTDPGNPDLALQAAALRDIFKRDLSPAEVIAFYTKLMALFAEMPRYLTARLSVPIPPEWGDGSWGMQPPAANIADFWWWDNASMTIQPKPWTKQFLDTMAPGWDKAMASKPLLATMTAKRYSVSAPRLSSTIVKKSGVTTPKTATPQTTQVAPKQMPTSTKVALVAGAVVGLGALGYVGYVLVKR